MAADPRPGDRNPRTEDRQMLLDALLAATDRLIVTYTGKDERTNTPRPPAVPIGELLDAIAATVRTADTSSVVVEHPLQPFDPHNFINGALVPGRTWSFDAVTLEGARALTLPRAQPGPFLAKPLAPATSPVIEIDDLVRFGSHPVRAFLRRRLRISVADYADEIADDLSIELDGLGKWGVGQRLLDARLAGIEGRTAILAEIARGTLPPGVLGRPVIDEVFPIVGAIVAEAEQRVAATGATASIDVRVHLPDGRLLSGTVPDVSGDVLRTVTYSRVAAKHRMTSWIRLLALTAAHPQLAFEAVTIGRAGATGVGIAHIPPLAPDPAGRREAAMHELATLIDLYDRGLREPLPLYCATSAAYAEAIRSGSDPIGAAAGAWNSAYNFDKEDRELEHQFVLGGVRTFEELLEERPGDGEQGDGWEGSEPTRVGRCARRMWDGLLAREEVTSA
jgi:exodeoxyribonuclease V gamma subunit